MSDHSPEPWHIEVGFDCNTLVDAEGNNLITSHHPFWKEIPRILACVNACKGIPTKALESGTIDIAAKVDPKTAEAIINSPDEGVVKP